MQALWKNSEDVKLFTMLDLLKAHFLYSFILLRQNVIDRRSFIIDVRKFYMDGVSLWIWCIGVADGYAVYLLLSRSNV
jgi:hypothetical protein